MFDSVICCSATAEVAFAEPSPACEHSQESRTTSPSLVHWENELVHRLQQGLPTVRGAEQPHRVFQHHPLAEVHNPTNIRGEARRHHRACFEQIQEKAWGRSLVCSLQLPVKNSVKYIAREGPAVFGTGSLHQRISHEPPPRRSSMTQTGTHCCPFSTHSNRNASSNGETAEKLSTLVAENLTRATQRDGTGRDGEPFARSFDEIQPFQSQPPHVSACVDR